MDFSRVKTMTIPEGSVKQITDSQGRRIWHAPTLYRELEYIEGNKNPIINLGVKANNTSTFTIDYQMLNVSSDQWSGSSVVSGATRFFIGTNNQTWVRIGIGDSATQINNISASQRHKVSIKASTSANAGQYKIDNGSWINYGGNCNFSTIRNMCLFGTPSNNDETIFSYKCYMKLYSAQLDNVRDMVPAQRKSDNVVGMYDKINNIFYTNVSTGSFTAGPTTDEYPDWSE